MTAGPTNLTLSVVVVNYRSAQLTVDCVASLRADGVREVVVVDNASDDGCRELLAASDPEAMFVAMPGNRGYGAAANVGVSRTSGAIVVIANPDLLVRPGAIPKLTEVFAENPRTGAVGPRIDRPDGERYPSARSFPNLVDAAGHGFVGLVSARNPWSRRYLRSDSEEPGTVDWVSGAFLAVRRAAWDEVGGFDERFFMFMEDVDLCWRLHAGGWDVRYEPGARVMHLEGASRATAPYRMIVAHHRSLLRYGWRTASWRERLVMPVVALGLALRTLLLFVKRAAS